jgi:hypothetical protein
MYGKELISGRPALSTSDVPAGEEPVVHETGTKENSKPRRRHLLFVRSSGGSGGGGEPQSVREKPVLGGQPPEQDASQFARQSGSGASPAALARFRFLDQGFDSAAPFAPGVGGTSSIVCLNNRHPAFAFLAELSAEAAPADCGPEEISLRYQRLQEGTRLLITAWMEYETGLTGQRRRRAEEAREDWGRLLRRLVNGE